MSRRILGAGKGMGREAFSNRQRATVTPAKTGTSLIVLAAICGALTDCRGADLPVYIYADVSGSVRPGDVAQVLNSLTRRLSSYEGADAVVVSVTPFVEDAFMATTFAEVRIPGNQPAPCPASATEIRISKVYESARMRQCDAYRVQQARDASQHRAAETAKLSAAFEHLPKLPGKCTAVPKQYVETENRRFSYEPVFASEILPRWF